MLNGYIDCHNHLAEIFHKNPDQAQILIKESYEQHITYFMQGGIGPENWNYQLELQQLYPGKIGLCFGLHPYWIAEHNDELCEQAMDKLNQTLTQQSKSGTLLALGELGLDFRASIVKNNHAHQLKFFEMQLEMSRWFQLPLVFHFVQCFEECKKFFDFFVDFQIQGLVHSFNGPPDHLAYWIKKDLLLSIGGPVCHPRNKKLHESVKKIPLELLVLETDSPDQAPPSFPRGENRPISLWDVAKTIGIIRNLDAEKILDISNKNFQRVFGEIPHGS